MGVVAIFISNRYVQLLQFLKSSKTDLHKPPSLATDFSSAPTFDFMQLKAKSNYELQFDFENVILNDRKMNDVARNGRDTYISW